MRAVAVRQANRNPVAAMGRSCIHFERRDFSRGAPA